MEWTKKGLLIQPSGHFPWMKSHAALPVAQPLGGDQYRVYFSSRDSENRASVAYAELALAPHQGLVQFSPTPVLAPGELGCFDDSGVTLSSIAKDKNRLFLYYTGWSLLKTVKFQLFSGLAVSDDEGKSFHRVSKAPLLERTDREPYLNASPFVLMEQGVWRMWYVSGEKWLSPEVPHYNIKYAESADGVHWKREGLVCIDFESDHEYAISRPCVVKENNRYRMWFASRGKAYGIRYAESTDGLHWVRKAGIDLEASASGWDSKMVEYPFVFLHQGRYHMLYNGNDYGREGIGWAAASR